MSAITKIWFLIGLMTLLQTVSEAQSFKERVLMMRKEYRDLDSVHIAVSVQVFEDEKATTPFYREEADIQKQASNFVYKLSAVQMLINERYLVMVDRSSKEILCSPRSPKDEEKFSDTYRANLDSMLSRHEDPEYVSSEGAVEHYRMIQEKGAIRQIDVFLDAQKNVLTRMEYRYTEGHYVVIRFVVFDIHPVFIKDAFSEERYFAKEEGRFKAASSFQGYRVVMMGSKE